MEHVSLGGLEVSRVGLGTMGMSAAYAGANADDEESIRTIHRALDLGVTFIDTAEAYGPYRNEELVGQAIAGRRDGVAAGHKVRADLPAGWCRAPRHGQQTGEHPDGRRRFLAAARHRSH